MWHTRADAELKLDAESLAHGSNAWRDFFSKFDTCIAVFAISEAATVIFAASAAKLLYIDLFLAAPQTRNPRDN